MTLSPAQLSTLKADILANADPTVIQALVDGDMGSIANWYNQDASPQFVVWKTRVTKDELYGQVSPSATTWSWTYYMGLIAGEQGGWTEMWADDNGVKILNPSLPQIRAGWAEVFSGPQAEPTAQRAHIDAMSKRDATYAEKLFATGTGSTADPATMSFEGNLSYQEVTLALNS